MNAATQTLMTVASKVLRYRYPPTATVRREVVEEVVRQAGPLVFATTADIDVATRRLKIKYEDRGLLEVAA